MANILYGVQGTGHGHAVRALTIARFFKEHTFLFISDSDGYDLLHPEFRVLKISITESPTFHHTLQYSGTVVSFFKDILGRNRKTRTVMGVIKEFKPDVAVTDFEPFLQGISRRLGIPCLSLDHQHIARFCSIDVPLAQRVNLLLFQLAVWIQFRKITKHMVISFFHPELHSTKKHVKVFPPLLRQQVMERTATEGEHVLAYHGYSTTAEFHRFLRSLPHPVRSYGMNEDRTVGNVRYKKKSTEHFLDDLASCRYVVSTAGHTLLSEALYYGKPVMAFPIRNACEQFINGCYLEKNNYGLMNDAFNPSRSVLERFEQNMADYKRNIEKVSFCGNEEILAVLGHYFRTGEYLV